MSAYVFLLVAVLLLALLVWTPCLVAALGLLTVGENRHHPWQCFGDQGVIGTTMDGDYKLPAGIGAEVQQRAEAYFVGKDPFDIEIHNAEFFQKQKARVRLFFLEVALWDIIGKVAGQPLYKLWGAATDKVRPYAATVHFYKSAEERAEDALKFYELGFRAIKLRVHNVDVKQDLKRDHGEAGGRRPHGGHGGRQHGREEEGRSAAGVGLRDGGDDGQGADVHRALLAGGAVGPLCVRRSLSRPPATEAHVPGRRRRQRRAEGLPRHPDQRRIQLHSAGPHDRRPGIRDPQDRRYGRGVRRRCSDRTTAKAEWG